MTQDHNIVAPLSSNELTLSLDTLLPRGAVIMLAGDSGIGKSFVALDWAASIATGTDWFGIENIGRNEVVYVAGHGFLRLGHRLMSWMNHHDVEPDQSFRALDGLMTNVNFNNDESVHSLYTSLQHISPRLVVVDGFWDMVRLQSDADVEGVRLAYENLQFIARQLGVAVVVTASTKGRSRISEGPAEIFSMADILYMAEAQSKADGVPFRLSSHARDGGHSGGYVSIAVNGLRIESPGVVTMDHAVPGVF